MAPALRGAAPGGQVGNPKSNLKLILGAAGGFVFLLIAIGLVWHFTHRHEGPPPHETPHGEEHGRHGKK
jgi:hypothetical protein